uniref:Uncharacterized protein n=1 Tax=Aegilops tauschii subsp. strangulata TaxID=200361 RepID=A0A453F2F8_AEGTS
RDKGYDGVVLESWSRWAAYGVLDDPELRQLVVVVVLLLEEISFIYLRSTSHLCNGMTKVQSIFLYIRIKV